jgi:hypothetical protein
MNKKEGAKQSVTKRKAKREKKHKKEKQRDNIKRKQKENKKRKSNLKHTHTHTHTKKKNKMRKNTIGNICTYPPFLETHTYPIKTHAYLPNFKREEFFDPYNPWKLTNRKRQDLFKVWVNPPLEHTHTHTPFTWKHTHTPIYGNTYLPNLKREEFFDPYNPWKLTNNKRQDLFKVWVNPPFLGHNPPLEHTHTYPFPWKHKPSLKIQDKRVFGPLSSMET